MHNNICKNGFGAILRSIPTTIDYEEKQMKCSCFEKMREIAHLRDFIEARGMIDPENL